MNKLYPLLALGALIFLAFALNPGAERHREKITEKISERSQLERIFGIGHLTSFASKYHSLGVASYTTVNDQVTSYGLFGMVIVSD